MTYNPQFLGWENLKIQDLMVAYRKAKADCFYEKGFPTAKNFALYEVNLLKNLNDLLSQLQTHQKFNYAPSVLGKCRVVPKKLNKKSKDFNSEKVHFSKPQRAFQQMKANCDLEPEFRIVGDFPVETHILSALWINMVGHKFDAILGDWCYGARLKRLKVEGSHQDEEVKPFHISAIGSFKPYFQPYQKWRSDGLNAIRNELEKDRKVIAVSLDLKSYYHGIDPMVIANSDFYDQINLKDILTPEEKILNKALADLLKDWSLMTEKFSEDLTLDSTRISGGLVIGLTAVRVISNIILYKWDELIIEKMSPIFYGRYVDDMFLVIRDNEKVTSNLELMKLLQARLGKDVLREANKNSGVWEIHLGADYQLDTKIELQSEKQKVFVLEGQGGLDLLDSIAKDIYELSSEHRLMPSPDSLGSSTAARVLTAATNSTESADTLRKADGLDIKRLSWALQLRHVFLLAHDLPKEVWTEQRNEFYQFAFNHVLRPEQIFAQYTYLPRLIGFAVNMGEWTIVEKMILRVFAAIDGLKFASDAGHVGKINGINCKLNPVIWKHLEYSLANGLMDALLTYGDQHPYLPNITYSLNLLNNHLNWEDVENISLTFNDFSATHALVQKSDLAFKPFIEFTHSNIIGSQNESILKVFGESKLININDLVDFLKHVYKSQNINSTPIIPHLFPTRPYSVSQIAEFAPVCLGIEELSELESAKIWARYVRAIRGIWVKASLLENESPPTGTFTANSISQKTVFIGDCKKNKVIVAITSFLTEDKAWAASAANQPDLSVSRYEALVEIVNQARKLRPKPEYLILPELSLPLKWVDSVTKNLQKANISLIAGTEYCHIGKDKIISHALLNLSTNQLGFPSFVRINQPKLEPAVDEERNLLHHFGKSWDFTLKDKNPIKPVYVHNGLHFGVMVCSELQNSKARVGFQGKVDALMVLAWNTDVETFSALVESTALDVHAYTILVNNRQYGDSRVRSPAKKSYMRDLARLSGGKNDFSVAVELDIHKLRAFQSREKRWTGEDDPFKPMPEGFKMQPKRKCIPE